MAVRDFAARAIVTRSVSEEAGPFVAPPRSRFGLQVLSLNPRWYSRGTAMLTQRLLLIRGMRATLFVVALVFMSHAHAQTNGSRKRDLSQIPVNTWVKL